MKMTTANAPKVFISYSHRDRKWLEQLQVLLAPLEREGRIDRWDDTRIDAGGKWREEIQKALDAANVAVLLVSDSFLASEFIADNELPILLNAAEKRGLKIVWVLLTHCLWDETEIAQYQAINDPGKPLERLNGSRRREVLVQVCKQIIARANSSNPGTKAGVLSRYMPSQNRVFTGREAELRQLHAALHTGNAALIPPPTALHGMGGVGKTQTAVEYIYLYHTTYDFIFWTYGASLQEFQAQLAGLASELDVQVPAQADQNTTLQLVRSWFATHSDWLLVVDNLERLHELWPLLPRYQTGRILLTTRETVPTNLADSVEIHHLSDTVGATLLLRRAGLLLPKQELGAVDTTTQKAAKAVSDTLGGLALALDQAGAYMQERSLQPAEYLRHYAERRQKLHPDKPNSDHRCVDVTFVLALEQVEQIQTFGKAAAGLVRLCAFLAPDSIPDVVFLEGASELGPELSPLAQNEIDFGNVVEAACRYALLRRESDPPALWMHRLAQEVVRDRLDFAWRREMADCTVHAVNAAFPEPEFPNWPLCERLLPHALVCAQHIADHGFDSLESAHLLCNAGWYLRHRARYEEAITHLKSALAICRRHPIVAAKYIAIVLNYLGRLYRNIGRVNEAVPLLEEAAEKAEQTIGTDHPDYAQLLDSLARAYYQLERYNEAEPLINQALAITSRNFGAIHPNYANHLNNLADLCRATKRYNDAETHLLYALQIDAATISKDNPDHATHLRVLGAVYIKMGRMAEAEERLIQARDINEKVLGTENPYTAYCYYWLGRLYEAQDRPCDAKHYFQRTSDIWLRTFGSEHRWHGENGELGTRLAQAEKECAPT